METYVKYHQISFFFTYLLSEFLLLTYALRPKIGVCNSPRDFFELDELLLCSSLRLLPRPRPYSFDILVKYVPILQKKLLLKILSLVCLQNNHMRQNQAMAD